MCSTPLASFDQIAAAAPGALGVIYDTALRGVHHQHCLRNLGWLTINRVAAASSQGPQRKGKGPRVEKSAFVETNNIDLFAEAGSIGIGRLTETCTMHFEPLRRVRTHRNTGNGGQYRWYNDYQLPADLGGGTVTVRLHGNDEDRQRRFNRTENVRPLPQADPDFAALYARRNDAESINRALEDTLWLRRAHSVGHQRQHLNLLTYALVVNSLARHRHKMLEPPVIDQAA